MRLVNGVMVPDDFIVAPDTSSQSGGQTFKLDDKSTSDFDPLLDGPTSLDELEREVERAELVLEGHNTSNEVKLQLISSVLNGMDTQQKANALVQIKKILGF